MRATNRHLSHVRIVGAGLIGSSIGLALRAQDISVTMVDSNPSSQALAQDLMGDQDLSKEINLVVLATPPAELASVLLNEFHQNPNATFIDVASVKNKVLLEIEASELPRELFMATHPMAGREVGGAKSARADLFQGRIWSYDPIGAGQRAIEQGLALIELCGASAYEIASRDHDQAVALVSHLPQLIASILAGQLDGRAGERALDLAGAGLRDTTRIAASSPELWSDILSSNSAALKPLLESLAQDLKELIERLEDEPFLTQFIEKGNRGRAAIPGKHGGAARSYSYLAVVIDDKPGQLAALFDECALAGVNVEDLTIEHSPEQSTGLITLALSAVDAEKLSIHLQAAQWKVHTPQ